MELNVFCLEKNHSYLFIINICYRGEGRGKKITQIPTGEINRMLLWKRSLPLSTYSGKCFCKAIVHIHPGERAVKEQRTMAPIGKVRLSCRSIRCPPVPLFLTLQPDCCPILIHILFLHMNERRF